MMVKNFWPWKPTQCLSALRVTTFLFRIKGQILCSVWFLFSTFPPHDQSVLVFLPYRNYGSVSQGGGWPNLYGGDQILLLIGNQECQGPHACLPTSIFRLFGVKPWCVWTHLSSHLVPRPPFSDLVCYHPSGETFGRIYPRAMGLAGSPVGWELIICAI